MEKNHDLLTVLNKHEITQFAVISFKKEFVLYEHKFKKLDYLPKSIIICLFPYYFGDLPSGANLSRYASTADYHLVIEEILKSVCNDLKEIYKDKSFKAFVDNSPFLEKDMACQSGLCIKGKHDICLNDKYGSYFNIGEIATDIEFDEIIIDNKTACCEAMPCIWACPTGAIYIDKNNKALFVKEKCLTYLSQKKTLTKDEEEMFKNAKTIWGCDLCQEACINNKDLKKTHINKFLDNIKPYFSLEEIENLSKEEYKKNYADRAFIWRGKEVMERNLRLFKNKTDNT